MPADERYIQIKEIINGQDQGDSITLSLSDFVTVRDAFILYFFNDLINQNQITFIKQPDQDLVVNDDLDQTITIQGFSNYLDYTGILSTMRWKVNNEAIDIQLEGVLGDTPLVVPILTWISLQEPKIMLTSSESNQTTSINQYGILELGTTRIPIYLWQSGGGTYRFQVGDDQHPENPLASLSSISVLFDGVGITSFLPEELCIALKGIAVTNIYADIQSEPAWVHRLAMEFAYYDSTGAGVPGNMSGDWEITPDITLRNLRGSLVAENPVLNFDPETYFDSDDSFNSFGYNPLNIDYLQKYSGEISGSFRLRRVEIPVVLKGSSFGYWYLGLQPDAYVELPSLEDLLGLMNQNNLFDHLPNGLKEIPSIAIEKLFIQFLPSEAELSQLGFKITTTGAWELIPNYFSIENINLEIEINTAAPDVYPISAYIQSTLKLGDTYVQLSLVKQSTDLNWTFTGSLLPDDEVNITGLADRLLKGFVALPKKFPKIIFKKIEFTVHASDSSSYSFSAGSETPWIVYKDLQITGFNIDFQCNANGNNEITGEVNGEIELIDTLVLKMKVELSSDNSIGWLFKGSSESLSEKGITGEQVVNAINQKTGLHISAPGFINNLSISQVNFHYQTGNDDLFFDIQGTSGNDALYNIVLEIKHKGEEEYHYQFRGSVITDEVEYALTISKDNTQLQAIGVYHDLDQKDVNIKQVVSSLDQHLGSLVPSSLNFAMKNALIAFQGDNKLLFGLDVEGGFQLSDIPLIGKLFSPEDSLSFSIKPIVANKSFSKKNIENLLPLIPPDTYDLPDEEYSEGMTFITKLDFPSTSVSVDFPVSAEESDSGNENGNGLILNPPEGDPENNNNDMTWWPIQQSFGPVHFEKIGFLYDENFIHFYPDVSFSTDSLSFSLLGLSIRTELNTFKPHFDLQGMAIAYQNPELLFEAALLKSTQNDEEGSYDEYAGMGKIQTKTLTLTAIGSYANYNRAASMFLYANIQAPIGGPAFFFVTGLAAGAGFNRKLNIPAINQVESFPLVQQAKEPMETSGTILEQIKQLMDSMHIWIPPSTGDNFLAIGVQFTSFKMIDSFALLTVRLGERFMIDILGISSMTVPNISPPKDNPPPLAQLTMIIKASFDPQDGHIALQAQLSPASYVFSPDCHLTGGYAFYAWFKELHKLGKTIPAGDFVQTLGGYHPQFKIPAHYPRVPRLGLNWIVDKYLSVKGGLYFALTPHALMAGGNFEANYKDGKFSASFSVGVDFLVAWQPYHYDAHFKVDAKVKYRSISGHVGVDLHVWGPEFSGKAKVKYKFISYTLHFGNKNAAVPEPLKWGDFSNSFLPESDAICNAVMNEGLINEIEEQLEVAGKETETVNRWIVDPDSFSATLTTEIPSKAAYLNKKSGAPFRLSGGDFGVSPMKISSSVVDITGSKTNVIGSYFIFKIVKEDSDGNEVDVHEYFDIEAENKNLPTGLWGKQFMPSINQSRFLDDRLAGVIIKTKKDNINHGSNKTIDQLKLRKDLDEIPAIESVTIDPISAEVLNGIERREMIAQKILNNEDRDQLLQYMGIDNVNDGYILRDPVTLSSSYLIAPQIINSAKDV